MPSKMGKSVPKPRLCRCGCKSEITAGNTLRKWATVDCALKLVAAAKARKERKALSESRKQTRADRARIKTLAALCSEVQRDVNRLVMEIYRNEPCVSCGSPRTTEAGHYFHAGSKYRCSRFRFDIRNIRPQCNSCNQHKGGGNQHEYRLGYIARYGAEVFAELEEAKRQADRGELAPLTKDEVIQIGVDARKRVRALQMERL